MTEVEFIPKQFVVVSETEPAAFEGLIWYNPQTGIWKQYRNGEWQIIIPLVVSDSEPQEKIDGMLWFDKANDVLKIYDEPRGEFRKLGINWEDIINKPTSYPPAPHIHGDADLSGISWDKILNKPTSFPVDLHRVKLPSPLTSDFITPSSVESDAPDDFPDMTPISGSIGAEAYDGDPGTYYEKAYYGGSHSERFVTWDLGEKRPVQIYFDGYVYVFGSGGQASMHLRLQVSDDNENWTTVASVDAYAPYISGGDSDRKQFNIVTECRYISLLASGYSDYNGDTIRLRARVHEIHLFTDATTIDDDETTGTIIKYGTFDIGAEKICSAVRVNLHNADYIPPSIDLYVSLDGVNFEKVGTYDNLTQGWNDLTFNARYMRYFKIESSTWFGLSEVDYYSRITDRVAAEHGHGSGVKDYLNYEKRSSKFSLADSLKLKSEEIKKKRAKAEKLEERIKTLEEEIEEIKKYLITLL